MPRFSGERDPLAYLIAPPPNETAEEKAIREEKEVQAQRVNDEIDEEIKKDRIALKKEKNVVKVLLLGQSESGKSTTLKNFQLAWAPEAWMAERASWRAVIQLNLVHSINLVISALHDEMSGRISPLSDDEDQPDQTPFVFTDKHRLLKLRLAPLKGVESDLKRRLGASAEEVRDRANSQVATPFDLHSSTNPPAKNRRKQEFSVQSWRGAFDTATTTKHSHNVHEHSGQDDATEVVASCAEDMKELWEDGTVRAILVRRRTRIEHSSGFFLDDIERIATRNYEPSDNDIVRARLRTLAVQEYRLRFEHGSEIGREWRIYDVGGSRTSRAAWLPFFDQVDAIIFLAPISAFDERLSEDTRVNRLEDSFLLWKSICSAKLLAKTTTVIFLNKCDLLQRKLKSGVPIKRYLPSYGDREPEVQAVTKYLKHKFKDIHKQCSPEPRMCYAYGTSVTDTEATAVTLGTVRDGILRNHLKQADLV